MNTPAVHRQRRFVLLAGVAVVALVVDFVTKQFMLNWLAPGESVEIVGELLRFTLVFNSGAAFSIGSGVPWLFFLIASGVVVYILVAARKLRSTGWAVALGLILGGACGNLIDRVFRAPAPLHGEVVDWLQVPNWPVFNVADSCIVVGGILAVIMAFKGVNMDGSLEGESGTGGEGERA
ncbi:signal peptidase II [Allosalinactinospora lopnorensis]|uniref:signal peptidase II n=1 Tax=Allosalinactinospora lopnorensis TaxID=1352348 RepID=UPI000623C9BB|nr:signal peptidase II [Allosalinactinospora lopnorensis]